MVTEYIIDGKSVGGGAARLLVRPHLFAERFFKRTVLKQSAGTLKKYDRKWHTANTALLPASCC